MDEPINVLANYAQDPENDQANFLVALAYEELGQTAAACSFFLRCADRTTDANLAYNCLCKIGLALEKQGNRSNSVRGYFNHALHLMPKRPEAYFLLSRLYERQGDHVNGYTYAKLGMQVADFNQMPLVSSVDYPGSYGLIFQLAVSAWWWGRREECRQLLLVLKNEYASVMDEAHFNATQQNLSRLGCGPESQAFLPYTPDQHDALRFKFEGSENITRNYSQVYQDMFVLAMLNGKKDGTYLEIGAGGPYLGNNTALLEELGWTGVGIEYDNTLAKEYRKARKNIVLEQDATTTDYTALLKTIAKNGVVDYLQLDCEPSSTTYKIMETIPFDQYRFAVLTYEHDHYVDMSNKYRELSREFLSSRGYVLVANDISPDGRSTFEDWWCRPELIDPAILDKMIHITLESKKASDYLFPFKGSVSNHQQIASSNTTKTRFPVDQIDMGDNKDIFKRWIYDEVIVNRTYEKYHRVQDGDIVVDIGCNVGLFPLTLTDRLPAHVYCVEPSSSLISAIENNLSAASFPVTILNYGITGITGDKVITDSDLLYGNHNASTFQSRTFKDFIEENQIERIDFLKLDCEGGEYEIFTKENYEFLTNNVGYIAGEWHMNDHLLTVERFMEFRDLYLTGNNFRIFEPYVWKEVTHLIHSDQYVQDFFNWWNPIEEGAAQLLIYIDNRKT